MITSGWENGSLGRGSHDASKSAFYFEYLSSESYGQLTAVIYLENFRNNSNWTVKFPVASKTHKL